ncbi:hypothetical protein LTR70_002410 [Exophiala xenobiotica]|uniref:Nephrocystin 3-like N-terminal domain-containing protein n=1 Tax=Lithohypha guttulata TaxID=1690604 RepID=A0ABR0KKU2_9EURO|nr:hypothetical protein LTR24_001407 [Lithohypha guttulata]KAK5325438.1 hypothetical protein LTR70_002410 [Exophiala xenobiotica]
MSEPLPLSLESKEGHIYGDLNIDPQKGICGPQSDVNILQGDNHGRIDIRRTYNNYTAPGTYHSNPSTTMSFLYTSCHDDALDQTPPRFKGTCDWILRHDAYKQWYEQSKDGFLWYTAPPGYGKSTMAKFLVEEAVPASGALVAYFSFAPGASGGKKSLLASRAILYQVCIQHTKVCNYVFNEVAHKGEGILGNTAALWRLLSGSVACLRNQNFIIAIDSMDHCDENEVELMMSHFRRLISYKSNTGTSVKIMILCGPYHNLQKQYLYRRDDIPSYHISIDNVGSAEHTAVKKDVKTYLYAQLVRVAEMHSLDRAQLGLLAKRVLCVENPTFLWSRLVMDFMLASAGYTGQELTAVINHIPRTIKTAYGHILQRCRNHEEARTVFSIIIAASRPLTLKDLDVLLALDRSVRRGLDLELLGEQKLSRRLAEEGSISLPKAHYVLGLLCVRKLLANEQEFIGCDELYPPACNTSLFLGDYANEYWTSHIVTALQRSTSEQSCSEVIDNLVNLGLDLKRSDADGKSLLHYAVNPNLLKLDLLHHAVSPNIFEVNHNLLKVIIRSAGLVTYADRDNFTSLHYAVLGGDARVVNMLVNAGFSIDAAVCRTHRYQISLTEDAHSRCGELVAKGLSVLHAAAYFGIREMVTLLLSLGADITLCDEYGQTPLHLVVSRSLLSPKLQDGWEEASYMPEYHYADYIDDFPKWAQRDLEKVEADRIAIVNTLCQQSLANVKATDSKGRTPLHVCPFNRDDSAVRFTQSLLSFGSDIHHPDKDGLTPLHLAARAGDSEAVKAMVQKPEDLVVKDSHGRNALHHAASGRVQDLIAFIFHYARGQSIELSMDVDGRHASHYCFHNASQRFVTVPQYDVLKTLIDGGVPYESKDNFGQDALAFYLTQHHASTALALAEILDLLARKCDVHYKDSEGMYLIHHLAYSPFNDLDIEAVATLHKHGAPITITDQDGKNVIHHAAIAGTVSEESLRFLEGSMQLDIHLCDRFGRTPLSYARELSKRYSSTDRMQTFFRDDKWRTSTAAFRRYAVKTPRTHSKRADGTIWSVKLFNLVLSILQICYLTLAFRSKDRTAVMKGKFKS